MDRRRGASEIKDLIHLDEEGMGDVVSQQLEVLVVEEVLDVATGASKKVVDAKHLVAAFEQAVGEMRPEEARSPGD